MSKATKDNTPAGAPTDQLRSWYKDALIELTSAKESLLDAQKRLSDAEQRVKSIESLLILENEPLLEAEMMEESGKADLVDEAVAIIEDAGHPMRISEIRDALLERNVPLPGKGNDANLIATFQRSNGRIVRVSRGLYGLSRETPVFALRFPNQTRTYLHETTMIGRSSECDIILADKQVSPKHAEIAISADKVATIVAVGESRVEVNGKATKSKKLKSGDTISIGATDLVFEAD